MDDLTPPLLKAIREVKWTLRTGKSMKVAVEIYLERTEDSFASRLRPLWTLRKNQPHAVVKELSTLNSHFQQAFWDLIERGCTGQPVLEALTALEEEVEIAAQAELDHHLSTLPFKVLMPLLFLQFPAYLILLLGPLVRELQHQLGG